MDYIAFGNYQCPKCNLQFDFLGRHPNFLVCPGCLFDMTDIAKQSQPNTTCRFCGKPACVRQVPVPVPISDAYCDDCTETCRELYASPRNTSPPAVIESFYTICCPLNIRAEDHLRFFTSLEAAKQKAIHRAECEDAPVIVLENLATPVFLVFNNVQWIPEKDH